MHNKTKFLLSSAFVLTASLFVTGAQAAYFKVLSPNGGEYWTKGGTYPVSIECDFDSSSVDILLHRISSDTYTTLLNSSNFSGSSVTKNVTVPDTISIGSDYRIVVTGSGCSVDENDNTSVSCVADYSDESDSNLTINSSNFYVKVLSPNGGRTWTTGNSYSVTFEYGSSLDSDYYSFQIYLYKASNGTMTGLGGTISPSGSPFTQNFTLPSISSGSDYKILVRVFNQEGAVVTEDYSDDYLAIEKNSTAGEVRLFYPNGNENLMVGSRYNVRWNTDNLPSDYKISISVSKLGQSSYQTVLYNLGNDGEEIWWVPDSFATGEYVLKITAYDPDYSGDSYTDKSDDYFTVVSKKYSLKDGDLIRDPNASGMGKFDVYIVKITPDGKRFKRLILNPSVFTSYGHLKNAKINLVDQVTMDSFITSDLVRADGDYKVYKMYPAGDTGERRWIKSSSVFIRLGYDWDSVFIINMVDRDAYRTGTVIN